MPCWRGCYRPWGLAAVAEGGGGARGESPVWAQALSMSLWRKGSGRWWLVLSTLLATLALSALWEVVVEPALAERFGFPHGQWQHVAVTGLLVALALATALGTLAGLERRHRAAEAARRHSEERFRQLVESTRDWVWEVDASGVYTYCSPQCQRLLGYAPEELIGRSPFDLMPPRHARRLRAQFARLAAERGSIDAVENINLHRDGREVCLETSGVPFFGADGALLGYRGIDRDVTERHRAEAAIRALNAELEDRVRQRTAELEVAFRELESFSYSVSHDLRAPLRGIDGFGQALLEDYGERLDDTGREYLQRIRAATRRMGLLIEDLMSLSRVSRQEMRVEPVDLSALVEDIGADLASAHGIRELKVMPGLVGQGDSKLLRLALWNLLDNAWKFTGRSQAPRVEFGRVFGGAYFVRDNGAGFDMAYAHKLFAPFQRLHGPEDYPGTGIGLAIVQRVVHRHDGRIWAEAAPGAGAAFYFTLPARNPEERRAGAGP